MKLTLLKKVSNVAQMFYLLCEVCTAILSLNSRNNNYIFTVSEIQTRKLNNPTTISFAGVSLTMVRFNLLE